MMCHGEGSHWKTMGMMKGLVLIVIGVLWWMTNYGSLDAAIWDWLLPLLVVLLGVKLLVMPMCKCEGCSKMNDEHGEHSHA